MASGKRMAIATTLAASMLAATAGAQEPCPKAWEALAGELGPAAATSHIWTLYKPPALTILGQKVSYVVVERDTTITTLYVRLGTQGVGTKLPSAAMKAFERAYPEGKCYFGMGSDTCDMRVPGDPPRGLFNVRLQGQSPPGRNLAGPSWSQVTSDQKLWERDQRALALRCMYRSPRP
jgi:hypothetical protein